MLFYLEELNLNSWSTEPEPDHYQHRLLQLNLMQSKASCHHHSHFTELLSEECKVFLLSYQTPDMYGVRCQL